MVRRLGKKLQKAYEAREATPYDLSKAVALVRSSSYANFDETVDVAIGLGIDSKRSDQTVRGAVVLPHGTGKTVRVAVFAKGGKADEARSAGADVVGDDDLAESVKKGQMDFERCIATPDMMGLVGQLGRILGPRGMMPNPKLGTVTDDVTAAVSAAKGGQITFRNDKAGIIHAPVGRVSFAADKLVENIRALLDALERAKPQGVKGIYLRSMAVTSTMGIGVMVDMRSAMGRTATGGS